MNLRKGWNGGNAVITESNDAAIHNGIGGIRHAHTLIVGSDFKRIEDAFGDVLASATNATGVKALAVQVFKRFDTAVLTHCPMHGGRGNPKYHSDIVDSLVLIAPFAMISLVGAGGIYECKIDLTTT